MSYETYEWPKKIMLKAEVEKEYALPLGTLDETKGQYGEPWMKSEFGRYLGGEPWSLMGQSKPHFCKLMATTKEEEFAERIRACVNFLAGVPTEMLLRPTRMAMDNYLASCQFPTVSKVESTTEISATASTSVDLENVEIVYTPRPTTEISTETAT